MQRVAYFISLILNPAFLVLLLILLSIEKSGFTQSVLLKFTLMALLFNVLIPFIALAYFIQKGMVFDDVLQNREVLKNRPSILALSFLILLTQLIITYYAGHPEPLFSVLILLTLLVFFLFLISLYKKISLHVALVTAFCFVLLNIFGGYSFLVFLLIPVIVWSRAVLLRHTRNQMIAGFLLAGALSLIIFYFV